MVCFLSHKKKRVSRNWIGGINFSLIKGEQPNFYAFSCNSLLAVQRPSSYLVLRRFDLFQTTVSRAFRQDFDHHTTPGSIVQCSNLHVRPRVGSCDVNTIHDREDVSSIFPIALFSLPDLILHARHIRPRFKLPCAWFLSPQVSIF